MKLYIYVKMFKTKVSHSLNAVFIVSEMRCCLEFTQIIFYFNFFYLATESLIQTNQQQLIFMFGYENKENVFSPTPGLNEVSLFSCL